jgi:DnaJ-class molecular chaperone
VEFAVRSELLNLKDYYAVLGVSHSADTAAIHSAFRALARRYHPDIGREGSANKFTEALEAYQTLSDPDRRHQHDLDLGRSIGGISKTTAEPLFQEHRRAIHPHRTTVIDHEDLFRELLRWIDSELDTI